MILKKFKLKYLINHIKNYFFNTKFYSIFLLSPIKNKDWNKKSYTKSHFSKGKDYHKKFDNFPGRKIIWELEKKIINELIKKYKIKNINSYLDFACGTGRVAKFLEKKNYKQYLLDSSPKMLNYAKTILKKSNFVNKDFTKIKNLQNKFDLITAFRFFPNAEPHLRKKAMKFISKSMKKDAILIFNNHRNFWSLPYFFKRLTFRSDGFGMTHREVTKLIQSNNLTMCEYKSVGLITDKEKGVFIIWRIIDIFERILFSFYSNHRFGYNIIYIVKKC